LGGFVGHFIKFLNWQRIQVGTDSHDWPRHCSLKKSHHSGFGDTSLNWKSQSSQKCRHFLTGAKLAIAEFRMTMKVSSNVDEFGLDCFGLSFYERQVHKLLPEYAPYVPPLSVKLGTDQFTTDPASSYPRRQSREKIAGLRTGINLRHGHQRWL